MLTNRNFVQHGAIHLKYTRIGLYLQNSVIYKIGGLWPDRPPDPSVNVFGGFCAVGDRPVGLKCLMDVKLMMIIQVLMVIWDPLHNTSILIIFCLMPIHAHLLFKCPLSTLALVGRFLTISASPCPCRAMSNALL